MHPRLRRQLAMLRTDLPPAFRQLISAIDRVYREADTERAELEESLASIIALLHRAQSRAVRARRRKQERLKKSAKANRRLERVLEKSRLALFELTADLIVRWANPAAATLCGAVLEGLPGKRIFELLQPVGAAELSEKWSAALRRGEPVARTLACSGPDGRSLACDWVLLPRMRRDGSVSRVTLVLRDQTEAVEKNDAVREREDRLSVALSGTSVVLWDWDLPANRLYLSPRWQDLVGGPPNVTGNPEDWLDRVHPEDAAPLRAALSAHIDGHTDSFGHELGDQLLQQIGRRLESCLREGDTLARHGGDEFTMWLDDVRGSADAVRVADRVHEVMREPFELQGQQVHSSASIGVAVGSAQYQKAEDVLRDADVAMYRAKALGKARTAVFQREVIEGAPAHVQMESDLRSALVRNELCVHYMPIVDVMTGKVRAVEALARWQHPRLGLVPA